jgi:hypothetical protein
MPAAKKPNPFAKKTSDEKGKAPAKKGNPFAKKGKK